MYINTSVLFCTFGLINFIRGVYAIRTYVYQNVFGPTMSFCELLFFGITYCSFVNTFILFLRSVLGLYVAYLDILYEEVWKVKLFRVP